MREDKVLVLDTDVTVLNDVYHLWKMFEKFSNGQVLGLVENQSNWYVKALSYGQRPWPALGRGFNTGVMLMHLRRLRDGNFASSWESVTRNVLKHIVETSLADQDVINAMIHEDPTIVHRIECTWNIQLSDHTLSDTCYRDSNRINVCFVTFRTSAAFALTNERRSISLIDGHNFRFSTGTHRGNRMFTISTLMSFESCTESFSRWTAICCENVYSAVTGTRVRFQWVKRVFISLGIFFYSTRRCYTTAALIRAPFSVQRVESVSGIREGRYNFVSHAFLSAGVRI